MDIFDSDQTLNIERADQAVVALRQLLASEGWKAYIAIVEKQQIARLDAILLTPLQGVDAAFEQEYKKGEIAGMRTAISLPETMVETLTEALAEARSQREAEAEKGDQ